MRVFGLIGYPLSHSFSPGYFAQKFKREGIQDANYLLFPLPAIEHLDNLLVNEQNLCGFNVTIPYKQQIIPFLHEIDPAAAAIGAVNTVLVQKKSTECRLKGYNTDVVGVLESLRGQAHHKKALVLGNGGASKAVVYALNQLDIPFTVVSRTPNGLQQTGYDQLTEQVIATTTLIINTTPLGMFPHTNECPPLPFQAMGKNHFVFDLIYNPEETELMKKASHAGAQTLNGLTMLHAQAEASWRLWNQ